MKSQKSHHATSKGAKKASLKKLSKYIDEEVTLIHENLEELKLFLGTHRSMSQDSELHTDPGDVTAFYDSANDLFKQIAIENESPMEPTFYETLVLRKKKKQSS